MTDDLKPETPQSKGGKARAGALSKARRSEIGRIAAAGRWDGDLPAATHEGTFDIGGNEVACAVLPNGMRLITQATFLRAIGRSRSPKAGTGVLSTVDDLPFFLQAEALKPFIDEELAMSTTPLFYRTTSGAKGVGYDARLLPKVAEVYLRFRDAMSAQGKTVGVKYEHIVKAADILMRGLASVGIVALVDEATGFQHERSKNALAKILEEFIAKELQPYVSTFPVEYYQELFRLRGLEWNKDNVKRPQYFGHLTNDIVYRRLAPGVLSELKKLTPKDMRGRPTAKLFQNLNSNKGYPKLVGHLGKLVAFMQVSDNYKEFVDHLDKRLPRQPQSLGDQMPLDFEYSQSADEGTGI